jgi:adenylate kinase family enzyme
VANRFLVYGVTGSGKSILAAQISAATGIPWHSVDDLTWEPGWVPVDHEEQRRRIAVICARPAWILDTAYGKWLDVPLARAEVIVALDYPRWLSLSRLTTRTVRRLVDRRTICNGNRETLRQTLGPGSILRWHFQSFARKRARIRAWANNPRGARVVRLTTPRQATRWLRTLSESS